MCEGNGVKEKVNVCPLRMMGSLIAFQEGGCACIGERCQWFDEDTLNCAVYLLAMSQFVDEPDNEDGEPCDDDET